METLHTIYSTFAKHNMAKFLTVLTILFTLGVGSVLGQTFTRISAASDLSDGDEIIFVNQAETYACGTTQNNNNRTPVAITTSSNSYSYKSSDNVQVFIVKVNGSNYGFHNGSGYIYSASSSSNYLRTNTTASTTAPSGTAAWTLSVSNNVFTVKNASNTNYYLAFNGTSYFSQYKSGQSKPYIYKKVTSTYKIIAKSNNETYGTVSLTGTTITAYPKTGYRVSTTTPYTISPTGSATVSPSENVFTVTPTADCTITINFEAKPKYTVTFNAGEHGTCATASLTETTAGAGVELPYVTPNSGYRFLGWATTDNATIADAGTAGETYQPSSNITLYAVYKQLHTITWMVGSNSVHTEEVANATGVTQTPADPANNAIGDCADAFVGWSEKSAGSTPQDAAYYDDLCSAADMKSKHTSVTGDKTFYAVFASVSGSGAPTAYTAGDVGNFVLAAKNGSKWYALPANPTVNSGKIQGVEITVTTTSGVEHVTTANASGYTWTIANATNGQTISDGSKYIYHSNGGASGTNLTYGNSTSYTWKIEKESAGLTFKAMNGTTTNNRGMLMNETKFGGYSLTNEGENDYYRISVLPISDGVSYSNYVTNCCALATATNLAVSGTTANSATLTWTAPSPITGITELQVQVRDENGIVKVENLAANATTATITELSECTEYTFCIASVGDCEVVSNTITAQPYSGAKTVTFVYGNEQPNTTFTTDCDNQSTALPIPTWSGYRFMGWFTAESDGTEIDDNPYTPTEDITLFAHWEKEYTVTYDANGGYTTCVTGNYIEGETVTLCTSTPSKTGYTFAGWTYSPEVTITDGKFTMPASNVTITAQWTINQYTVTWNPNGGNWAGSTENIVHTYDYGATINSPADPTCDGYRFIGWNTTVASTMPANNITYTAQWKQNYTITFHDGDDTTPWTQTVDAESIDLNTYVGTHVCGEYNFAGWSTDATQYNDQTANITTWVTGTYTPTASIDLYAVYVKGDLATDFTLNCDGGVYEIWEKGHNQHMAGRQTGGGDKFYTTEYWDANNSESNGAPFTITKVADNTYTLQNADGQYITRDSYYEDELEIEETWENADRYKWTISNGTNGTWRFTNKAATSYALVYYNNRYFELRSASSVTAGNTTTYDLELTPAQTNVYQSNPNCGPYTITFETGGGEFIQGNYKYSTKKTSNLTEPTISQFPAAELDGYTFAGWKDGSPQEDINYEPYLKKADDNLVVSSNKTYHAVYYYYDEEEEIDWSEEFTTGMYAEVNGTKYFLSGTPNRGTMSSTTDCGYVSEVTITPGTGANAGKYKITVNGVGMAPEAGETDLVPGTAWWTITETSAGSGEYKISGETNRNVVLNNSSFGHYAYNAQGSYNGNYHYPSFGKCLEHHWTSNPPIKLTVTYNPNGATSGTAPIDSHYYMEGDKVYVLGSNGLQKENYAFGGWNTQADGEGDNYEEGEDFNITKNTTLYAKWDCATYVNITKGTPVNGTFNLSVTGTQYTCENGFVVSVTDIVPATGYRFDHITQYGVDAANVMIDDNAQTVTYDKLSNGSSTINVVFVAILYTVTWDPNGGNWDGSTDNKVETYNYGASITKPADPTRIGYTFAGWSPTPASNMPAENVTYTAQWIELTNFRTLCEYTVTWELAGGQIDGRMDDIVDAYTRGQEIVPPTHPTLDGWKFMGWDPEFVAGTTMQGEDLTYVAQWAKAYTVTYDANGGSTTCEDNSMYAAGDEVTVCATTPTKIGHAFAGWQRNDDSSIVQANGTFTMPASNVTLIAQWNANQHTVTWNPGEGGHWDEKFGAKVETYNYGDPIIVPDDPEKSGYVFAKWEPDVTATMPDEDLEYTAVWYNDFCESYTFHTGNADVWNSPQEQICFTHKEGTEWQITDYVIPTSDAQSHFLVAYRGWPQIDQGSLGGHSKSATSTWSATMYIAPTMDFSSADNSPKLGHAKGAIGTLRIFDDSSWDNLCVGFIPKGYGITLTSNSSGAKTAYAFNTTTTDHKLETNVVTLPGVTNNKYTVGLATQAEGEYVSCDHSNAAELINKMGVTEMVAGKRMVYLKPNDDWKSDGARFAAYFFNNGGNTWINMTDPDGDGIYGCEIPDGYSNVIFCRMNGGTTANNWDNKWNQTQDITLPSSDGLAKLYTITGWDNSCSGPTNLSPKRGQNGKFRMWDDSRSKNWYVHFIPYYLLTYNANGGEGEMPAEEYNTEDANNKVTIAANGFTRRGYDFVKWNTQADGAGTDYNSGDEYTMTSDATIYAQWKVQEYTINYKDQGNADYSGTNLDDLPTTHTYGIATTIPNGEKIGYTFEGWYLTPECDGTPITELVANDYIADITLYAKWTFAMEYDITNAEPVFITSAAGQTIKGTTPLTLAVSNMPVGTKVAISAPNITFYDEAGNAITEFATKNNPEQFNLTIAYTPTVANTTEQPTITLDVLGYEEEISDKISCRSLPATFAIVAKVGNLWYALPSQGLNSTDALVGYPVEVDNQNDPTAVTAVPANADWSLRGVYAASHSDAQKDRFKQYGANIMFENNASPAKMLNASVSDNYLLTNAEYDSYKQSDNQGLYEWTPTTTDLETYQLTNEQRSRTLSVNTATVFGVHAQDKAVEQVRFLPIQNRYTPAALQVVEWKENSVVIMYNGNPAQTASVSVNGGKAQETDLSSAQRDIAVYELAANGLAANPTQRLSITIGTEKVILSIPYIISGAQTDLALLPGSTVAARQEVAKVSDMVILKGATLTADGAKGNPYNFRNVTIYGGGKLVIPSEAKGFGVASLTLRAGGVTDAGEYDYVYPQFELRGTFTNSAAKINYDYITDYDHWYHLVLPFAGDLGTIKYPTEFYGANVAANNKGSWQIKRYAGEIRATGNYNAWVDIETEGETSTIAGQGYIFWGAPKKVSVNGGDTERQKWGIQRITMSVTASDAETEKEDKTIAGLGSYENVPNNSHADNDQGWNLVGNPYMVNLTDMATTGLHACKLVEVIDPATGKWNGQWEWNDETNIRYLTIPSEHFDTYTAKTVNQAVPLVAGRAFFVQLEGEANAITFAAANRASLMPALRAANDKPVDIETGVILSNETLQDEVNFWIKDGKTNDYEYNADYPKTPNNNQFNIYGVHTNGDLSWVATGPEYAAESMPIGYQVPAAGTYMLSLSEIYNSDGLDALYVTDHALSPEVTVDIMSEPYEFSVNQAETNNERFTVSVRVKAKTENGATGLDNVGADGEQIHKFIYQDKMYILHHGVIYDATGKRVITINK